MKARQRQRLLAHRQAEQRRHRTYDPDRSPRSARSAPKSTQALIDQLLGDGRILRVNPPDALIALYGTVHR